jgi:AcrR family transcriptional regulator
VALSVRELQRARILAATASLVCEGGVENTSVTRILTRARVPRGAFYDLFANRDDCLRAAVQRAIELTRAEVQMALQPTAPWPVQLCTGLHALLAYFEQEPETARLCLTYSRHPAPGMRRIRSNTLDELAKAVEAGRRPGSTAPGQITAEALVAGVLGVIEARLKGPGRPALAGLAAPLTSFIVLPYRGASVAEKELAFAGTLPARRAAHDRLPTEHGPAAAMRVTHRTMRVLAAIAEQPGLTNAQVAQRAGITDQGQISKLLKRLQGLGLVENADTEPGSANSWRLNAGGYRAPREGAGRTGKPG